MFSNNKPLLSKDLKVCLNEKSVVFLKGEMDQVKEKEKELVAEFFQKKQILRIRLSKDFVQSMQSKYGRGSIQ